MHNHRPDPKKTTVAGFAGPIPGARENRRAHGNIRIRETCRCGATRLTNRNAGDERGPWIPARD